ncbi:hypothetical protein AAY473_026295 [Plecturocebus cupreus]
MQADGRPRRVHRGSEGRLGSEERGIQSSGARERAGMTGIERSKQNRSAAEEQGSENGVRPSEEKGLATSKAGREFREHRTAGEGRLGDEQSQERSRKEGKGGPGERRASGMDKSGDRIARGQK